MKTEKYREVPIDVPPELVRSYQSKNSVTDQTRPLPPAPAAPQRQSQGKMPRMELGVGGGSQAQTRKNGGSSTLVQRNRRQSTRANTSLHSTAPRNHILVPSDTSSTATYKDLQTLLSRLNKDTTGDFNHANVTSWAVSAFATPDPKRAKKVHPVRGTMSDPESAAPSLSRPPLSGDLWQGHSRVHPPHTYSQVSTPFSSMQDLGHNFREENNNNMSDPETVYKQLNSLAAEHGMSKDLI